MDKVIVEKEVLVPQQNEGTASNAIWAIALIIIVAMIVGALYYSGVLRRLTTQTQQKINVEVSAPAAPAAAPAAPANR